MKVKTGLAVEYLPRDKGSVLVRALGENGAAVAETAFTATHLDEARILYMEATELLRARAKLGESPAAIRSLLEKLFAAFRGEKVSFAENVSAKPQPKPSGDFRPNPGKQIEIDVDGATYERLPVRTRLITLADTDIMPILEDYVRPYLKPGDILFISEKALTITQGRVVDMGMVKPARLARFLARNISNNYGSGDFRGFGHGTSLAMQLFIEEAGYLRVLFAAAVAALTRPLGIRGAFYWLCGKQAKSVDCPMSFLILDYAHAAKLAPHDPDGAARRIKKALGAETVILDANYLGAFSLGKSSRAVSEPFIQKAFRDNPLGQSDEMTPFCILRQASKKHDDPATGSRR